jgi:hypothetical protein
MIAPRAKKEWVYAIICEQRAVEQTSFRWAIGAFLTAVIWAAADSQSALIPLIAIAVSAILYLDWHTCNSSAVIAVTCGASFMLSYWRPRAALGIGASLGLCLFAGHLGSDLTGWYRPFYQWKPLGLMDWLIIILAVAPVSFACAVIGGRVKTSTI